jgi:protein RecA
MTTPKQGTRFLASKADQETAPKKAPKPVLAVKAAAVAKPTKTVAKSDTREALRDRLRKALAPALEKQGGHLGAASEMEDLHKPRGYTKTGIHALDILLSGNHGGLPHGRFVEVYGPESSGKCLHPETLVVHADGHVTKISEVVAGDSLLGDDSTPRKVLSIHTGVAPSYRVELSDGSSFVCSGNHILVYKQWSDKKAGLRWKVVEETVDSFLLRSTEQRRHAMAYKVPMEFPGSPCLPIDAYFLGAWLGDGNSTGPSLTAHIDDTAVSDYVTEYASKRGLGFNVWRKGNTVTWRYSIPYAEEGGRGKRPSATGVRRGNSLLADMHALNLIKNKHIPACYLTASRCERLRLLAGLLDTDGYLSPARVYEITQKRKRLASDIMRLCLSLGFRARMSAVRKTCQTGATGTYYRVTLSGERLQDIPVLLDRKRVSSVQGSRRNPSHYSMSITSVGSAPYVGVVLDGNQRHVLADGTVVHNSATCDFLMSAFHRQGGLVHHIDTEMTRDDHRIAKCYGLTTDDFEDVDAPDLEAVWDYAYGVVKTLGTESKTPNLIILDSLAATPARDELSEKEHDDSHVGLQARSNAKGVRKTVRLFAASSCVFVFVNQLRDKIGAMGYGPKTDTPGGRALKYAYSIRLQVNRVESIKAGDNVVGQLVRIVSQKNKHAPPRMSCDIVLSYKTGIDVAASNLLWFQKHGVLKHQAKVWKFKGEDIGGKANFAKWCQENPEAVQEAVDEIRNDTLSQFDNSDGESSPDE